MIATQKTYDSKASKSVPSAGVRKTSDTSLDTQDKDAAKQCLLVADRLVKEGDFENARHEVEKAQKLDPTNPYIPAFLERITYFEEVKKKAAPPPVPPAKPVAVSTPTAESPKQSSTPPPPQPASTAKPGGVQPTPTVPPKTPPPVSVVEKKPAPVPPPPQPGSTTKPAGVQPAPTIPPKTPPPPMPVVEKKPAPVPPPPQPASTAKPPEVQPTRTVPVVEKKPTPAPPPPQPASTTKPPEVQPAPTVPVVEKKLTPAPPPPIEPSKPVTTEPSGTEKGEVNSKLDEMKHQIEELTRMLQMEKLVRQEISSRHLQAVASQFRVALEKAWVNGAPKPDESARLHELAVSMAIPEEAETSLLREVKIEMYSRAVKEVVAKRKLLRSSSSTLEWLRKVYQISVTEYLENESKFLLDLVADQYKGTLLLISEQLHPRHELTLKLKSSGFAVVHAATPDAALEKIDRINPNVILCETEFTQSTLSGVRFLHVVRASSKLNFIPFILMCQKHEMNDLNTSELRPNEGFIQKPFDFDALSSMVNDKLLKLREYISSMS